MADLSKQNNTPRPLDNPLTCRAVVGSSSSSKMLEQTVSERPKLEPFSRFSPGRGENIQRITSIFVHLYTLYFRARL